MSSGDPLHKHDDEEEVPTAVQEPGKPEWMADRAYEPPRHFMMESLPLDCFQESRMQLISQVRGVCVRAVHDFQESRMQLISQVCASVSIGVFERNANGLSCTACCCC